MTDAPTETQEKQRLVLQANYKLVSEFGEQPAEFLDIGFGASSGRATAGHGDLTHLPGLQCKRPQ